MLWSMSLYMGLLVCEFFAFDILSQSLQVCNEGYDLCIRRYFNSVSLQTFGDLRRLLVKVSIREILISLFVRNPDGAEGRDLSCGEILVNHLIEQPWIRR